MGCANTGRDGPRRAAFPCSPATWSRSGRVAVGREEMAGLRVLCAPFGPVRWQTTVRAGEWVCLFSRPIQNHTCARNESRLCLLWLVWVLCSLSAPGMLDVSFFFSCTFLPLFLYELAGIRWGKLLPWFYSW